MTGQPTPDLLFEIERFLGEEGALHRPSDLHATLIAALEGHAVLDGQVVKLERAVRYEREPGSTYGYEKHYRVAGGVGG